MSEAIEKIECLIIGSGPAGYTAAIYAARADLKPIVYTGMKPGGQLTDTTEVDNFPGYPEGTNGPEMMVDMQKQAERFGTDVRFGYATKCEFSTDGSYHKIEIDGNKVVLAKTVIISTGASAKWLGLESEERLNGFGVSADRVEIWGTGTPRREFLWSEDMADACVFLMQNRNFSDTHNATEKEIRNTHINIGTGQDISIKELAEAIKKTVGFNGKLNFNSSRPDGTMVKLTDVSKLQSLGWKHKIEIEAGIERVYRWYIG